jgi:hypothetical protein
MLYSQYIHSLILYTVNNKHLFDSNNKIHKYKTRNNNLYFQISNLTNFKKGYCTCSFGYFPGVNNTQIPERTFTIFKSRRKLEIFKKGAYVSGIKVFNHLPQYIKALTNDQKCFTSILKRFLYHRSLYSINEYYEYKEVRRVQTLRD